ncbi:hypothetical protein GOODEAATRI_005907, partial [Goodea atripinnis]
DESSEHHLSSPYHRHSYLLTQNDSQDVGADQSDADCLKCSFSSDSSQPRHMDPAQDELLMLLRTQHRELTELWSLVETMPATIMAQMQHVLMRHQEQEPISKSLEPVTGQLNNTISAKLAANTTDAIGRAAAEAMQGPIQTAYKDTFQSTVLPVFERGCQSMFQQINDSFKQGTHEFVFIVTRVSADIQQLETHMKNRKQREQDTRDPMIGQLQQMMDSFQSSTDQLASSISATESILSHVQRIVKGEVSLAMKEQQAVVTSSIMQAMRSAAGTPVPTAHLDYQTQQANILQFLQQGQLNQAFQQALSATDLNLVLYVCETIDSQQVFGQTPCPLSQPVLLSLIQQLSSNLATRSELKISYLEDALMNLDHSDPLTRDHMSSVLAQVRPKLITFLQQDPHSPLSKRARRLLMMLQGLVNH